MPTRALYIPGKENSELLSENSLAKKVDRSTNITHLQGPLNSSRSETCKARADIRAAPLSDLKSSRFQSVNAPTEDKSALLSELNSSRPEHCNPPTDSRAALLRELKSSRPEICNAPVDNRAALLSELKSSSRPETCKAPADNRATLLSELKSSRSKHGHGQTDERTALLGELKLPRVKSVNAPTDASKICKNALLNEIKRSRLPKDEASMRCMTDSMPPTCGKGTSISGSEGILPTKDYFTSVPKLAKYSTMQKVGVPYECILNRMKMDGIDEKDIDRFKLVFGHGTEDIERSRPVTAPASVSRRASKALLRMHWEEVDAEKVTKSLWAVQDDFINDQDIK